MSAADLNLLKLSARSEAEGERDSALNQLRELVKQNPSSVELLYALGGSCDYNGYENEAIVCYEQILNLGFDLLPENQRPHFLLSYGSTLRNVGRCTESIAVLQDATKRFPNFAALKVFKGLSHYTAGDFQTAAKVLFETVAQLDADDSSILHYSRALKYYQGQLT